MNAVYVCQKFFSNLVLTISHSIPLIFITFAMTILFIGFIAFCIQVLKTRVYLKKYLGKRLVIPESLETAINNLDLNGKVDVVKDLNKFSFCHGLLRPRICLSTGLLKTLTPTELKAVLLHENYHFKKHDPLRIVLSKTISSMFFFIPILGDLQKHYALTKEIAADNMAIEYADKDTLISVLNKLLVAPAPRFNGVAALASLDDLEKRILYLAGKEKKAVFRPSPISISLSAFIVLFSMALVNTPVYAVRADDSCKAKEASYSKDLMYTPATYTPK